jgi:GNAT superfamily N-acetyltransferase
VQNSNPRKKPQEKSRKNEAFCSGGSVIAATTHDNLAEDLAPNVHVYKRFGKEIIVDYFPEAEKRECSLIAQMRVEESSLKDYKALSHFHYRSGRCAAPRKIFSVKRGGELCGVVVYGFPSPFCFGRSRVWKGALKELMRDVSVVSRVVVHPKYRGIGLGVKLVRETLALVGTPFVEAVAVMARFNPFFEKAGMVRVAESKPKVGLVEGLACLERLGFDLALLASSSYCRERIARVGCEAVVDVLGEVSRRGAVARKGLVGLAGVFPTHEAFMAKISELDADGLAKVLKRLSFLAQSKVYLFWRRDC